MIKSTPACPTWLLHAQQQPPHGQLSHCTPNEFSVSYICPCLFIHSLKLVLLHSLIKKQTIYYTCNLQFSVINIHFIYFINLDNADTRIYNFSLVWDKLLVVCFFVGNPFMELSYLGTIRHELCGNFKLVKSCEEGCLVTCSNLWIITKSLYWSLSLCLSDSTLEKMLRMLSNI